MTYIILSYPLVILCCPMSSPGHLTLSLGHPWIILYHSQVILRHPISSLGDPQQLCMKLTGFLV